MSPLILVVGLWGMGGKDLGVTGHSSSTSGIPSGSSWFDFRLQAWSSYLTGPRAGAVDVMELVIVLRKEQRAGSWLTLIISGGRWTSVLEPPFQPIPSGGIAGAWRRHCFMGLLLLATSHPCHAPLIGCLLMFGTVLISILPESLSLLLNASLFGWVCRRLLSVAVVGSGQMWGNGWPVSTDI